jgi:magnesium-protoporphyrin IX monomethyl ester (oxidative) cyclase
VFRVTSEISKQVFPLTLDLDNPAFRRGLTRMKNINDGIVAARRQGGIGGWVKRMGYTAAAGVTFVRLFLLPVHENVLPAKIRLQPAW